MNKPHCSQTKPTSAASRFPILAAALIGWLALSCGVVNAGTLTLTLSTNAISEGAGDAAITASVALDAPLNHALTLIMRPYDATEIHLPTSVAIPAGSNSTSFLIDTVNDGELDGPQSLSITVGADGFLDASASLLVTDDDTLERRTIGGFLFGTIQAGTNFVINDIKVEKSRTLSIAPSSHLLFADGKGLRCGGTLIATGGFGSEIHFTSASPNPTNGSWAGLRILSTGQPTSVCDHVEIAFAENGLWVIPTGDQPHVVLSHSSIHHSLTNGVRVQANADVFIAPNTVLIVSNRVSQSGSSGIYLHTHFGYCQSSRNAAAVIGNDLFQNGFAGIEIDMDAINNCTDVVRSRSDNFIANNHIHGNGYGIRAYAGDGGNTRGRLLPTVQNNLIVNNSFGGIWVGGTALAELAPRIISNTIVSNGGFGVSHGTNLDPGFILKNNIIALNQQGITSRVLFSAPANVAIAFNDVWSNGDNWINYPPSFGSVVTTNLNGTAMDAQGNISANPLFGGPSDYHLQPDSPAVDAGTTNLTPTVDFEGQNRHGFPDMGYDELTTVRLAALSAPTNGTFPILVTGGRGTPFTVETTSDLRNWTQETSSVLSNRNVRVGVPLPGTNVRSFLRTAQP